MNAKRTYLYGARVIVTGASDGIGKEIVRLLVGRFNCIVLGIARRKDKLAALKTELGENFDYIAGDVTDKSLWERIAAKFDDEPYSVLVNNAGIMPPFTVALDQTDEELRRVIEVNYFAPVTATRILLPRMKAEFPRPVVVNVCSSSALCPLAATSAYSASKSALKAFTEALAAEEKGKVYVGCAFAGFTKTSLFRDTDGFFAEKKVSKISSTPQKTAKKIVYGMAKRKRRMIIGADARAMNFFYKLAPKSAANVIHSVMKSARLPAYDEAFAAKNEEKSN